MAKKERETDLNEEDEGIDKDEQTDSTETKINAFAVKLGEETENQYSVYIYRMKTIAENGRKKRPFVTKYVGIEPDPAEIAEKFRGGSYLVTFIWYVKKNQKSRSFVLDIDEDAFPPLPKPVINSIVPFSNSNMSEQMQLQMLMITSIADIMKSAYTSGNNGGAGRVQQQDPMEMVSTMIETMEEGFSRTMALNQRVMERVYLKNMEKRYGLTDETTEPASSAAPVDDTSIIGKYAPIVRDIVSGLKSIFGLFGEDVPSDVVKKVRADDRIKALLKDRQAIIVIGKALRKEFGIERANEILTMFGMKMVPKDMPVVQTPDIPVSRSAVTPVSVDKPERANGKGDQNKITPRAGNRGKKAVPVPV